MNRVTLSLAKKRRHQLGGKDFDERLIGWLRERFEQKSGVSLMGNVYAMARLKEQAEKCKVALSTQEEATVRIPLLAEKDGLRWRWRRQ